MKDWIEYQWDIRLRLGEMKSFLLSYLKLNTLRSITYINMQEYFLDVSYTEESSCLASRRYM